MLRHCSNIDRPLAGRYKKVQSSKIHADTLRHCLNMDASFRVIQNRMIGERRREVLGERRREVQRPVVQWWISIHNCANLEKDVDVGGWCASPVKKKAELGLIILVIGHSCC